VLGKVSRCQDTCILHVYAGRILDGGGYGFNMPLQINKSLILKPKNGENYGQIQWKSLKIVPGSTSQPGCTVDISSQT